jgi:hypothetical protein
MKSQIESFGQEQYTKGWDEAMAQAASNPGNGDPSKIYTEAELNAEIALVKEPLEAEIAVLRNKNVALKESVNALQGQIDEINVNVDAKISEKIAEFKADLLKKYEEQQVAESQGETGFLEALK